NIQKRQGSFRPSFYCRPVGFEVEPMGVGAVPSVPLPWMRLLVKDWVAPLIAVPFKVMSLLASRMVTVPPAFCTPVPLLWITLLLTFTSVGARGPDTKIPATLLPDSTERLIVTRPLLMTASPTRVC